MRGLAASERANSRDIFPVNMQRPLDQVRMQAGMGSILRELTRKPDTRRVRAGWQGYRHMEFTEGKATGTFLEWEKCS